MILYKTQSSAKRRTDDLILSGRSLINSKNIIHLCFQTTKVLGGKGGPRGGGYSHFFVDT